jgi:hypothetical protein
MNKDKGHRRQGRVEQRDATLFSVTGEDLEARREQRLETVAILKNERTPLEVIRITEAAERITDAALSAATQREPPCRPLACAEGCAWCCYKRVGVAAPEVIRIASHVRAAFTEAEVQALLDRIQQVLEYRRQHATPLPCPLLLNDRCSAYAVRPMTCRGFNSSDAILCRASVMDNPRTAVPIYSPQMRITSLVLDGMRAGLTESGLKGELLELSAALRIALQVDNAVADWLDAKPVFASARLP